MRSPVRKRPHHCPLRYMYSPVIRRVTRALTPKVACMGRNKVVTEGVVK